MTMFELKQLRRLPPGAERDRLVKYIESVPDPITRRCLELRYREGLPWAEVARRIGGGNSENNVRMRVYRYLRRES